jgi:hypothetical protein
MHLWYIIVPALFIFLAVYFTRQHERELNGYTESCSPALDGFYLDIYNQCAEHINNYENEHSVGVASPYLPKIEAFLLKYGNRPDEGNTDSVALTILWNFTSDALKCGHYHFHIGSLTPEGKEVLAFAEYCLDTALQKRYITKQDADEAKHALMQGIKEAG